MDANKDEALKCLSIAKNSFQSGDLIRALKFLKKARGLDPSLEIDDLLSHLDSLGSNNPTIGNPGCTNPSARGDARPGGRVASENERSAFSSSSGAYTEEQVNILREIKSKKDYYEILGLQKSCSVEDVHRAFKKLSLKVHPDKNKAPGAEQVFKMVSQAFQCLKNEESRKRYDVVGSDYEKTPHFQSNHSPGFENKPNFRSDDSDRGKKPNFGSNDSDNGKKPNFGSDDSDRGKKPNFGSNDSDNGKRPNFGSDDSDHGKKPNFGSNDSDNGKKPNFGSDDSDHGKKPNFGSSDSDNGKKPNFGSDDSVHGKKPNFGCSDSDDGKKPNFGSDDSHHGKKPNFGSTDSDKAKKPKFGSDNSDHAKKPNVRPGDSEGDGHVHFDYSDCDLKRPHFSGCSRKLVLKVDMKDDRDKRKAMKVVSNFPGIGSVSVDMKEGKLTAIGDFDIFGVITKLRKYWHAEILSVGPANEEPSHKKTGEEPSREKTGEKVPKKENPKNFKEEPEKENDKKKTDREGVAELLKTYSAYYPYPYTTNYYYVVRDENNPNYNPYRTNYYHANVREENNPNSCVIC